MRSQRTPGEPPSGVILDGVPGQQHEGVDLHGLADRGREGAAHGARQLDGIVLIQAAAWAGGLDASEDPGSPGVAAAVRLGRA
jgi:hypothetical protein